MDYGIEEVKRCNFHLLLGRIHHFFFVASRDFAIFLGRLHNFKTFKRFKISFGEIHDFGILSRSKTVIFNVGKRIGGSRMFLAGKITFEKPLVACGFVVCCTS